MSPTVPPQRGDSETVSVLSMLVTDMRGLRESVTSGFRDLTEQIAKLRDETVSRREFDRYRDEHTVQAATDKHEIEKAIDKSGADAAEALRLLKEELAETGKLKRWVIGTLVAAAGAAGVLGGFVETIIHH